jgi:hypothetical protein
MVNKMNISSLFARSYVDALSVAMGPLAAKAQTTRRAGTAKTIRPAVAVKSLDAKRETADARW